MQGCHRPPFLSRMNPVHIFSPCSLGPTFNRRPVWIVAKIPNILTMGFRDSSQSPDNTNKLVYCHFLLCPFEFTTHHKLIIVGKATHKQIMSLYLSLGLSGGIFALDSQLMCKYFSFLSCAPSHPTWLCHANIGRSVQIAFRNMHFYSMGYDS